MAQPYQRAPAAEQVPEVDQETEEEYSDDEGSCGSLFCTNTILIVASVLLLFGTALLMVEINVPGSLPWHRHQAVIGGIIELDSQLPAGAPVCDKSTGTGRFTNISISEPAARNAAVQLVELTKSLLLQCTPTVGLSIGLHLDAVASGQESLRHSIAASWKYAPDCESITYRLKVMPPERPGWVGVVNYDLMTGRWQALVDAFRPKVCDIHTAGTNNPFRVANPGDDPDVQLAAAFAVAELNFIRAQRGCQAGVSLNLDKVDAASEQLAQDMLVAMQLSLNATGNRSSTSVKAGVTVFFRYSVNRQTPPLQLATGLFGEGQFDVCSDFSQWGANLTSVNAVTVRRRLMSLGEVEDLATTSTNRLVAQKQHYFQRRLLEPWVKPPVAFRNINLGDAPEEYDPRQDPAVAHCFSQIPVFDQGSCGCCYAASMSSMLSLRLCIAEVRGGQGLQGHQGQGTVTGRRMAAGCADDPLWESPAGFSCAWYAAQPRERCLQPDIGQLSYCQQTCRTCRQDPANLDFPGSLQDYTYSTEDLAVCSCNDFDPADTNPQTNCKAQSGCQGGSVHAVWDAWMRLTSRPLRRRQCMPLTIKCLSSAGVVNPLNPLSSAYCARQQQLEEWDRSCSCIAPEKIPRSEPQCSHTPDSCATLPRPDMVFQLMSGVHTLSNEETVMNARRHILEQGPVYAGISVSRSFMSFFDGAGAGLVYPGDDQPDIGGHAIVVIGWGQTTEAMIDRRRSSEAEQRGLRVGSPFWLFRNSWTSTWADGGHGRILAGKDVKGVESRMYAAMFGSYKDFSPPVCQWNRASFLPRLFIGGRLCRFQMKLEVQCSEDATMQVHWADAPSSGSRSPDATSRLYTHRTAPFRCPAQTTCVIDGIDLLSAGFGLKSSTMSLKLRAWDAAGSHSSTPSTFKLDALQGAETLWGQEICQEPQVSCAGCSGAPTPDPDPASNAGSKEQPSGDSTGLLDKVLAHCFPPSAAVRLADGQERAAADLRPGDRLLSQEGQFAEYLLDFHSGRPGRDRDLMVFLSVEHSHQRKGRPLLISRNHLLFVAGRGVDGLSTIPAGELVVGDSLLVRRAEGGAAQDAESFSRVTSISEVVLPGYSAPLTEGGTLFVEDVLVSSYALLSDSQLNLWRRGPSIFRTYTQEICHFLAAPFRLAHAWARWWSRVAPASWSSWSPSKAGGDLGEGYLGALDSAFNKMSQLFV